MASLIPKKYGSALYQLAVEQDSVLKYEEEIIHLRQILIENTDLMDVLNHPKVLQDDKIALIEEVLTDRVLREIVGLLVLLIKKNREAYSLQVLDYFLEQAKAYKKIVTAYVTSAIALSKMQKDEIKQKLEDIQNQTVEVKEEVNPDIIGGLIIRIGDRIMDNSIQGKVKRLAKHLEAIQLV